MLLTFPLFIEKETGPVRGSDLPEITLTSENLSCN